MITVIAIINVVMMPACVKDAWDVICRFHYLTNLCVLGQTALCQTLGAYLRQHIISAKSFGEKSKLLKELSERQDV